MESSWESHSTAEYPDTDNRDNHHHLAGLGGQGGHDGPPPLHGDGQHGQHTGWHGGEGDELSEGTKQGPEIPHSENDDARNKLWLSCAMLSSAESSRCPLFGSWLFVASFWIGSNEVQICIKD